MFEKELPSCMYNVTGEINDKQHQQIHTQYKKTFFSEKFFQTSFYLHQFFVESYDSKLNYFCQ